MKKVYKSYFEFSLDNGETWESPQLIANFSYEENPYKETSIKTFDKLKEWVEEEVFPGGSLNKTFFKKEEVIYLEYLRGLEPAHFKITNSNFNKYNIRVRIQSLEICVSFDTLKSLLSADDFCKYLKDRGFSKENIDFLL